MPVLESPPEDPTRRVTSDELTPDSFELDSVINPLVDQPLFIGEDKAPGLKQNPANQEGGQKRFRDEYRERKEARKNGTPQKPRELPATKNQSAITAADQAVIGEIENLVKNKKYGRALAMIAGNPKVREIMRSKVSEIRNQMALEAAKSRIKMLATNAIRSAVMDLLIVLSPWWEIILVIILCIIALVIGIAIMMNRPVDNPPTQVPIGIENGNSTGIYLSSSIMTPSMKLRSSSGLNARTKEIHLEATAGGWSPEEAVDKRGNNWCIPGKGCLSMGSYLGEDVTEETMNYYATARFPYVYGYDFDYNGAKPGAPRQGWGSITDYAGKKMIMFNPKTNKAVVAIAAEFGPAPWTGVCSGKGENGNNSNNKRLGASCPDQRQAWNARNVVTGPRTRILPQDMRAYDIAPPSNYTGRIAGGEPKLRDKIGIQTDETVIIGFAADQSLEPGTVLNITEKDIVRVGGDGRQTSGGSITEGIITAARAYLSSKTFEYPGYSPCAKFVTSVLNDAKVMGDYERACVILNNLLSGAASQGILTKQFPEGASTTTFSIAKVDEAGSNENQLLNNLVPGDVIIVSTAQSIQENNHTMIYAGKREGKHTVIHTTASSNVIAKRGGVAHTTLASIRPKDNGNYDHWSAYSFRNWNGKVLDGSANN